MILTKNGVKFEVSGNGRVVATVEGVAESEVGDDGEKRCHYCGKPAVKTNFFDVWVCNGCEAK